MKMLFYKLQQTMKTAINYVQISEDYFSLVLQKKDVIENYRIFIE